MAARLDPFTGLPQMVYYDIPSGSTFPANPEANQFFMHTPTGRTILHQWDGTNWNVLFCYGDATVYVNGASGTDSPDKGGSTGSGAFATIQYAVDRLICASTGDITINVAAGTYRETVTIVGFRPIGDVRFKIVGNITAYPGANGLSSSSISSQTLQATSLWTTNEIKGMRLKIIPSVGDIQYKLIQSNTADTIKIVGDWNTTPSTDDNWNVDRRNTIVSGADSGAPTTAVRSSAFVIRSVAVEIIDMIAEYCTGNAILLDDGANSLVRLKHVESRNSNNGVFSRLNAQAILRMVYVHGNGSGLNLGQQSMMTLVDILADSNTSGITMNTAACANVPAGPTDGEPAGGMVCSNNTNHGVDVSSFAQIGGPSTGARLIECVDNGGWGVRAIGGLGKDAHGWTYSGNTSGTYTPTAAPLGGTT